MAEAQDRQDTAGDAAGVAAADAATDGQGGQDATGRQDKPIKKRKNGLYPAVSDELAAVMKSGWADTERTGLEPIAQAPHAAARRAALSARFPGERIVVPAGNLRTRSNDTDYPFRASTEYVHLTGDQTEDAVLVLEPLAGGGHEATAYLLPRSDRENGEFWLGGQGELWVGRRNSLTEGEQLLGLPCRDVRKIADALRAAPGPVRVVRGHDAGIEAALTDKVTAERDEELKTFLSELRLVKDDFEIAELQRACDSTARGFEDVVKVLDKAEATSERYIEGTFFLRARVEGNDVGYGSICASGPHATTLHWVRNDGPVRSGDLLLLDAGVETTALYTADVTRTLPVSGRFSPLQKKVYDAVYDAQQAGIEAVKPGAAYRDFHEAAQRCSPSGWWSGGCWTARSSGCSNSASSAAGRCTAPATCSAWTCTTARRPAPSPTWTARWSPAWCSPWSPVCTSRRTTSPCPRSTAASGCASRTTSSSPRAATAICPRGCRAAPPRWRSGWPRSAADRRKAPGRLGRPGRP